MFGIGFLELCVIAVAALLLLGPQKLPEFMQSLARFLVQIRRVSNEMKDAFDLALQEEDLKSKKMESLNRETHGQDGQKDKMAH